MTGRTLASSDVGDADLLADLRNGGESAFDTLVRRFHGRLVRAATKYVRDPTTAADVAQETWVAFLDSLDRFEERCSIQTWLFRILFNKAQTRVQKDRRLVPFSSLASDEASGDWHAVDPSRFKGVDDPVQPGHWTSRPPPWKVAPDRILERKEARQIVQRAIDDLPPAQGTVMILRDLDGFGSKEVCEALGISEANQRVLLHRARTRVRRALSEHYGDGI